MEHLWQLFLPKHLNLHFIRTNMTLSDIDLSYFWSQKCGIYIRMKLRDQAYKTKCYGRLPHTRWKSFISFHMGWSCRCLSHTRYRTPKKHICGWKHCNHFLFKMFDIEREGNIIHGIFFSCFSIFLSFWFCFSFYYLTHVNVLLTALEYPASNHIVTILLYLEYFPSHASRKHFLLALCKRLLNCRCGKCVGVLLHPHTHRVCVLSLACVISMDLLLDHFLNLICTFRAHFCALYAYIYMRNWLWILKSIGIYNKIK